MTKNQKEEIIAAVVNLLEKLFADDELPAFEASNPRLPITREPPSDVVEMLTVRECCDTIKGLNEYTVRQLVCRKEIPFVRAGHGERGKILIPKSALVKYFNNIKENSD